MPVKYKFLLLFIGIYFWVDEAIDLWLPNLFQACIYFLFAYASSGGNSAASLILYVDCQTSFKFSIFWYVMHDPYLLYLGLSILLMTDEMLAAFHIRSVTIYVR